MVDVALHHYLEDVRQRMQHIPPVARRRMIAEIVAHLEPEIRALRAADPSLPREDATKRAIEAFCPPEELLVAWGPEEGIIRRSSAEWVMHSNVLRTPKPQKYGRAAAAAGFLAILVFAAVTLVPGNDDGPDLEPMGDGQNLAYAFTDGNGTWDQTFTLDAFATFTLDTAPSTGCVRATLTGPEGRTRSSPACLDGSWDAGAGAAGDWVLSLHLSGYTGTVALFIE